MTQQMADFERKSAIDVKGGEKGLLKKPAAVNPREMRVSNVVESREVALWQDFANIEAIKTIFGSRL